MRVGIIGAMEVEVQTLKAQLGDYETEQINQFEFYLGSVGKVEVVVLLSGIGKVSAAVATTLLIERYTPDVIINTGTAGGLQHTFMGDIVIAEEVRYHDVDLTAFDYEYGQQSNMPAAFKIDADLLKLAKEVCKKSKQKVHDGLIVSGDSFISKKELLDQILLHFPTAYAVEMEATAIAQVCHLFNIPFVIIRAISDRAGEGNFETYTKFVAEAGKLSAQMNLELIEKIGTSWNK